MALMTVRIDDLHPAEENVRKTRGFPKRSILRGAMRK
jgi:hypothetical protein